MDRLEEIEERWMCRFDDNMPPGAWTARQDKLIKEDVPWMIEQIASLRADLKRAEEEMALCETTHATVSNRLSAYENAMALILAVKEQAKTVANAPPGELVRGQAFAAKSVCRQVVDAIRLLDSAKVTESGKGE